MEILTKNSNGISNTYAETKPFMSELFTWMQSAWAWSDSEITETTLETKVALTGKFYFKENVYMELEFSGVTTGSIPGLNISFHSPNTAIWDSVTHSSGGSGSKWWQISVAKGVSGFALAIEIVTSAPTTAKTTTFTMFFGKCVSGNNEEKYGAVFNGISSALRIADEDGEMVDGIYKIACNGDASYKSILYPLCNPATGAVFRNIYEPKFCPFFKTQFSLDGHVFQAGATANLPCLSDE